MGQSKSKKKVLYVKPCPNARATVTEVNEELVSDEREGKR